MPDDYRKDPEAISQLTPEQYRITQRNGTEPAFRSACCSLFEPAHDTGSAS